MLLSPSIRVSGEGTSRQLTIRLYENDQKFCGDNVVAARIIYWYEIMNSKTTIDIDDS